MNVRYILRVLCCAYWRCTSWCGSVILSLLYLCLWSATGGSGIHRLCVFNFRLVGATTIWCKSFCGNCFLLVYWNQPQCLMMIVEPFVVQTKKKRSFYLFTLSFFSFSCLTLWYPIQMWTSCWRDMEGLGIAETLGFIFWGTWDKKWMCLYDGSQHTRL